MKSAHEGKSVRFLCNHEGCKRSFWRKHLLARHQQHCSVENSGNITKVDLHNNMSANEEENETNASISDEFSQEQDLVQHPTKKQKQKQNIFADAFGIIPQPSFNDLTFEQLASSMGASLSTPITTN